MRSPHVLGGLLLPPVLAALLAGCGSDGSAGAAPTDAPHDAYCTAFSSQFETLSTLGSQDAEGALRASRRWAEALQETGTPQDMPEDARSGYEAFVNDLFALEDDASLDDLENVGADAEADVGAFVDYSFATCPDALSEMAGEMGDQMQEELDDQLGELDLGDLEGELGYDPRG